MDRLRASLEGVPIVDFDDYRYFVHPITDGVPSVEPALLRDVANEIVRRVDFDGVDRILAPEAMGIHVGTAVSLQVDVPLAIARKRSYGLEDEVAVAQVTGYHENELYINGIRPEHTVVAVDDVVSTGGTMSAVVAAVDAIGADLRRFVTVFDKGREGRDLEHELPTYESLLAVTVRDDRVVVIDDPDGR